MGFLVSNVLAIVSLTALSGFMMSGVRGQPGLQELEAANYEDSHFLPFQVSGNSSKERHARTI
jgi:hypothetical protein